MMKLPTPKFFSLKRNGKRSVSPRRMNRRRGLTLLEVMTAATIGTVVLMSSLMIFVAGMASWYKGEAKIQAESSSMIAVRHISSILRESMAVSVDGNGQGLTYRLPVKNGDGTFVTPAVWDGVTRRISLTDGVLTHQEGTETDVLVKNVITTDPNSNGGTGPYVIFTPGAGSNTRQVTIMIVTEHNGYKTNKVKSRARETIYLRNIPEITR